MDARDLDWATWWRFVFADGGTPDYQSVKELRAQIAAAWEAEHEQAREEGRREILREILKMAHPLAPDGDDWAVRCAFCGEWTPEGTAYPHKPDCLWLRAQSVAGDEK